MTSKTLRQKTLRIRDGFWHDIYVISSQWEVLVNREGWITWSSHRNGAFRVTLSPTGRYELESNDSLKNVYSVRDTSKNQIVTVVCRRGLRRALSPVPVRIGLRYNIREVAS